MLATILVRRDSAADWAADNPVLHDGEFGLDKTTRQFKFGDGVTAWNDLEFASPTPEQVTQVIELLEGMTDLDDTRMTLIADDTDSDFYALLETYISAGADARITAKRGAVSGIAPLDADQKLPEANLPTRLSAANLNEAYGGMPLNTFQQGVPLTPTNSISNLLQLVTDAVDETRSSYITYGTYALGYLVTGFVPPLPGGSTLAIAAEQGSLLRVNNGVVIDWFSPLLIDDNGTGAVRRVDLDGLTIDGNRTNNVPGTPYAYEHAALIRLQGEIEAITIRNLDVTDPVADVVYVNSWDIDTLTIDGMLVRERNGTRSDVEMSALPRVTNIHNFVGTKIEVEAVAVGELITTHDFELNISQAYCSERLDIGVPEAIAGRLTVNIDQLYAADVVLGRISGTIANSELHFSSGTPELNYLADLVFDNCDVYIYADSSGVIETLQTKVAVVGRTTGATWRDCRFHLVPDAGHPSVPFTGSAIQTTPSLSGGSDRYVYDTCEFDARFERNIFDDRTAIVELINGDYGSTAEPILFAGSGTDTKLLLLDGGKWRRSGTTTPGFLRLAPGGAATTLRMRNITQEDTQAGYSVSSGSSNLATMVTESSRIILGTSTTPPADGFRGDRYRLKSPVSGATFEWICTVSSDTAATWVALPNDLSPFVKTTTGISGTAVAVTPLYTVPTGKTFVLTSATIRYTTATTLSVQPTLGIGVAAGEDDIMASTLLTSMTASKVYRVPLATGVVPRIVAGSTISLGVDVAATAANLTMAVDLVGFLV